MTLRRSLQPARRLALGLLLTWGNSVQAEVLPTAAAPATPDLPQLLTPPTIDLDAGEQLIGSDDLPTEKVQDRWPSRTLKTERYVAQDENGNFFDHGKFTHWDEDGRMAGRGQFRHGERHGVWTRWFSVNETQATYGSALELGFQAPFTAQATFKEGKLHGTWTIVDARKRQVSAWEFEDGNRHGMSVWWHPEGSKFREVTYRGGDIDGTAFEYSPSGAVVKEEKYVNGFCHAVKIEYYLTGEVKSECETLFAKDVLEADDNFWTGRTAVKVVGKLGRDQRHGQYVAWSKEGEKILSGTYVDDQPHGKFTWYHDNGNRAIEGMYVDGKQDGTWTWWYENGLKEISGEYVMGNEGGNWRQWDDAGRVCETLRILPLEYNRRGPVDVQSQPMLAPPVPASFEEVSEDPKPIETIRPASFSEVLDQSISATAIELPSTSVPAVPKVTLDQGSPAGGKTKQPVLKPVAPRN